jgi:hypothetical protein
MEDLIAYIGTAVLMIAIPVQRRRFLHLIRIVGSGIWLIYGFLIMNWPVIIADSIALCMDSYALYKFWDT